MKNKKSQYFLSTLVFIVLILLIIFSPLWGLYYSITKTAPFHSSVQNIKIGFSESASVYISRVNSNNMSGFNVDIINAIALETGFDFDFVEIPDDEILISLLQGKVDCVIGMDYSHIPGEYIISLKPFLENKISAFSIKKSQDIKGEYHNKKFSILGDDPSAKHILDNISNDSRIFEADTTGIGLELLLAGVTDFFVGDKYLTIKYIDGKRYEGYLEHTNIYENNTLTTLITLPEKKVIYDMFTYGLREIKSKGTMDTITEKWFGNTPLKNRRIVNTVFLVVTFTLICGGILFVFARITMMLRRQVEERTQMIKEEKLLNEAIIQSLFEGLIFTDKNLIVISTNRAAHSILNLAGGMTGKSLYEIAHCKIFLSDVIECIDDDGEGLVEIKETILEFEEIYKSLEYTVTPVKSSEGSIIGVNLIFRDITKEKNIKEKIIFKDKLETIGRMTAGIAHEIRNPLTSIAMYMKLLPDKLQNESFRNQLLEDVPKEINRLDGIVKSLLDYARPSITMHEEIDLGKQLYDILRFLDKQITYSGINLTTEIEEGVKVRFDPNHLKQIVFNIVINSMDALKNVDVIGEKRIIITTSKHTIRGRAIIEISDNGNGIPQEMKKRLFEPFYTTKESGYGLGLSIVYHLVSENSAEIYYDNQYTYGAKFVIEIPLL